MQIPLGVIPENENVAEEMTEIMEELQSLYVPIWPDKRSDITVRVVKYVTYSFL